jgi:hypothetical protein
VGLSLHEPLGLKSVHEARHARRVEQQELGDLGDGCRLAPMQFSSAIEPRAAPQGQRLAMLTEWHAALQLERRPSAPSH